MIQTAYLPNQREAIKAFGKYPLGEPLALRNFEKYLGIPSRKGFEAWTSSYQGVQKLLEHLSRYTHSESSREKYLQIVYRFCIYTRCSPDRLLSLANNQVEEMIHRFVNQLAIQDRSRAYLNSLLKRLKTFFRVNGHTDIQVKTYFVPSRYRKRPEYIPTKYEVYAMAGAAGSIRNRAIILCLWSSGLRVSTFCSLNYDDIQEDFEQEMTEFLVPVYPEMKRRVPDSCKGRIPYFTFFCSEASEALRSYLRERQEKYGRVTANDPLFASQWSLWKHDKRSTKRLNRRGIGLIVKNSARLTGITKWQHVTPHTLRKAFESILHSPTLDRGRLDKATQEFFMGHILTGSQDPYYDKTRLDFHRQEYAKLNFSREIVPKMAVDQLIDLTELEKYLADSYLFIAQVGPNKIVVRKAR
jgi:integrase